MNKNEKHTKKEEKRESRRQTILVAIIESRCISNGNNVHFDDEKKEKFVALFGVCENAKN